MKQDQLRQLGSALRFFSDHLEEMSSEKGRDETETLRRMIAFTKREAEKNKQDLLAYILELAIKALDEDLSVSSVKQSGNFIPIHFDSEKDEVLKLIDQWTGDRSESENWYRSYPLAALGGRTAEGLVLSGQSALLRDYIDAIALGTFQ